MNSKHEEWKEANQQEHPENVRIGIIVGIEYYDKIWPSSPP